MNRYQGVPTLNDTQGRLYYRNVKYPDIAINQNDIYIITDVTDRLDLMANDYYQDTSLWWIISVANSLYMPSDSLYVPAGTQLRIPFDVNGIIQDYNTLNGIT